MRVDATLGCLASQMPIPTLELSPFQPLFHLSCSSSAVFFVPFNLSWSFSAVPALYPASFAFHQSHSDLHSSSSALYSASSALHLIFPALHPSSSTIHSASLARIMLLFRYSFLIFSFSRSLLAYPPLRPVSLALYPTSSSLYSVSSAFLLLLFRLSFLLFSFSGSLLTC